MTRIWFLFSGFIVLTFILISCNNDNSSGFKKEGDVLYKVHYRGDASIKPNDSDWVTVIMDYRLEDTVLFRSVNLDKPFRFAMIDPSFKGDVYDGLKLMGEGDSVTFSIVADSFFYKTANIKVLPSFVEAGSPMYYDVKLLKVQSHEDFFNEMEQEKERMLQQELIVLENYINEHGIAVEPTASGLIFIPLEEGYGAKPVAGDMCRVYLEVRQLDGTFLFSNFDSEPIDVEFGKEFDTQGFMEGLGLLNIGGSATLIVPSKIGVGATGMSGVEPFTTLLYKVELDAIRSVEEVRKERAERKRKLDAEKKRLKAAEPGKIEKYVKEHGITELPLESGVYFIETYSAEGAKPKNGDKVMMHYTLYLTNGFKVESSYDTEPIEFLVGQGRVVRAWEQAIPMMTVGSKAKLIVPSSMGYGSRQHGRFIEPYSPLVFDIELVKIVE